MNDAEEGAQRRRVEAGRRAVARWQAKHPQAARDLASIEKQDFTPADLEAWEREHPEAAAERHALTLYSEEVMRKMRMSSPTWEPPEWPY